MNNDPVVDGMAIAASRSDKDQHRAPTKLYRRAILQALESFRDFQSRSNLDSVRRHTQALLQEEKDFRWNDTIFMKAIKSIVQNGDIDLCANIQAELSPTYKRKRADSLSQRMLLTLEGAADNFGSNSTLPPCPILPNPSLQNAHDAQSAFGVGVAVVDPSSVSSLTRHQQERRRSSLKEAPKRTPEHDKWKITAKRVYVNAAPINPMDTH